MLVIGRRSCNSRGRRRERVHWRRRRIRERGRTIQCITRTRYGTRDICIWLDHTRKTRRSVDIGRRNARGQHRRGFRRLLGSLWSRRRFGYVLRKREPTVFRLPFALYHRRRRIGAYRRRPMTMLPLQRLLIVHRSQQTRTFLPYLPRREQQMFRTGVHHGRSRFICRSQSWLSCRVYK